MFAKLIRLGACSHNRTVLAGFKRALLAEVYGETAILVHGLMILKPSRRGLLPLLDIILVHHLNCVSTAQHHGGPSVYRCDNRAVTSDEVLIRKRFNCGFGLDQTAFVTTSYYGRHRCTKTAEIGGEVNCLLLADRLVEDVGLTRSHLHESVLFLLKDLLLGVDHVFVLVHELLILRAHGPRPLKHLCPL